MGNRVYRISPKGLYRVYRVYRVYRIRLQCPSTRNSLSPMLTSESLILNYDELQDDRTTSRRRHSRQHPIERRYSCFYMLGYTFNCFPLNKKHGFEFVSTLPTRTVEPIPVDNLCAPIRTYIVLALIIRYNPSVIFTFFP